MKSLDRVRAVSASGVVALVVALLTFGLTSLVVHQPASHLKFALTAGSGFTITSNVYASPACSGPSELLAPGEARCLVYSVKDNLTVPISVQSINISLDSSYPTPPADCMGSNLTLTGFSGSLSVPASGTANTPGELMELNDSGTNQDNCENLTYHFVYTGSAQYTDATSTALTSSMNPSVYGQSVTYTAAVTGHNASSDSSLPTGTVTFYSCTTAACTSTTSLGTGSVGAGGLATLTTSALPGGTDYIQATYGGSGTNYLGSTSNTITQTVTQEGTVLKANPVIVYIQLIPLTLYITLGPLSGTLTTGSGTPIAGQTITFAANPSKGSPVLCSAVTNASGYATCNTNLTGLTLTILDGGIKATYPGNPDYQPATGSAGLVEINLT